MMLGAPQSSYSRVRGPGAITTFAVALLVAAVGSILFATEARAQSTAFAYDLERGDGQAATTNHIYPDAYGGRASVALGVGNIHYENFNPYGIYQVMYKVGSSPGPVSIVDHLGEGSYFGRCYWTIPGSTSDTNPLDCSIYHG